MCQISDRLSCLHASGKCHMPVLPLSGQQRVRFQAWSSACLSPPIHSLQACGSFAFCLPTTVVVLNEDDVCPTLASQILTNALKSGTVGVILSELPGRSD